VSCVDRQGAAADFRAVDLRNGLLSVLVAYVAKHEALRLVGVALGDDRHGFDLANLFKEYQAGRHGPRCVPGVQRRASPFVASYARGSFMPRHGKTLAKITTDTVAL